MMLIALVLCGLFALMNGLGHKKFRIKDCEFSGKEDGDVDTCYNWNSPSLSIAGLELIDVDSFKAECVNEHELDMKIYRFRSCIGVEKKITLNKKTNTITGSMRISGHYTSEYRIPADEVGSFDFNCKSNTVLIVCVIIGIVLVCIGGAVIFYCIKKKNTQLPVYPMQQQHVTTQPQFMQQTNTIPQTQMVMPTAMVTQTQVTQPQPVIQYVTQPQYGQV